MLNKVSFMYTSLLPLSELPLRSQTHILADDLLVTDLAAVEEVVEAVVEVPLVVSLLQGRAVYGLRRLIDHLDELHLPLVLLLLLDAEGRTTRDRAEPARVEL